MKKDETNTNPANFDNTVLCPVIFDGRKFFGIRKFDCHCVELYTEKTLQGTYFTAIPISSVNSRKKNPTKARVEIETSSNWTNFYIYSDWGSLHKMQIHNSLSKEIEFAKQEAAEHGLL